MLASARLLRIAAVVSLAFLAFPSAHARAFCRETIEAESSGPCIERPGVPVLHWNGGCMTYVFNEKVPERLSLMTEATIRGTFEQSFETWSELDCGAKGRPFSVQQADGFTKTKTSEFLKDARNESVFSARTREEWFDDGHDPNALAITLLWHDVQTGEILDVDMELNTGAGRFADCVARQCGRDMMDLQNTVTHEAGHLLGLGHTPKSECDDCTMLADAPDGETEKRDLSQDDIDGYCALDLPTYDCLENDCVCPAPEVFSETRTVRTCACSSVGASTPADAAAVLSLGALAALVLARFQRRRARK